MKIGVIPQDEETLHATPHSKVDNRVYGRGAGRRTTYNNSAMLEESLQSMWKDVYEYPKSERFFRLNTYQSIQGDAQLSVNDCARQSEWSIANPEKNHLQMFQFFNIHNNPIVSTISSSITISEPSQIIQNSQMMPTPSFMVDYRPPESFMGAFGHLQPQFNCFDVNISIPKLSEYLPFSNIISMSKYNHSRQIQNPYEKQSDSRLLKDLNLSTKNESKDKYYFQIESVQSQEQENDNKESLLRQQRGLKQLKQLQASKIQLKNDLGNQDKSILWNYDTLFQSRQNFRCRDPTWQQSNRQSRLVSSSQIFQAYLQPNLVSLHSMELQLNLEQNTKIVLSDCDLMIQISKMLQNVECQLFTLEYSEMKWSLNLRKYRLETSLRGSLNARLENIFKMANSRSRIDAALEYIRSRPFRKIYFQLGSQLQEVLIVYEQLILQFAKECTLIEYLLSIEKLSNELSLLYNLIINHDYIQEEHKSYESFDYRFLNSEFIIFKQVVKLSRFSDSLSLQFKPLIVKLVSAVFKPILTILNTLLFEETSSIGINDEVYLKYYFDNIKDILIYVSRKIELIKEENNELYLICKMKDKMEIIGDLVRLEKYQNKWRGIFKRKRQLMNRIRRQFKRKMKYEQQKKYQDRMKFVYELKSKMYKQTEEENMRKRIINEQNRAQLQKLKMQIESKEKRRKLLQEIQKQKQRGLLIDLQLREKQSLAKEKEVLKQKLLQISQQERSGNMYEPIIAQSLVEQKQKEEQHSNKNEFEQDEGDDKQQQLVEECQKPQQSIIQAQNLQKNIVKNQNVIENNKPMGINKSEPVKLTTPPYEEAIKKQKISMLQNRQSQSYFRIIHQLKQKDSANNSSQSDQSSEQLERIHFQDSVQLGLNKEVNTSTCLQICIDDIIKSQLQIIQSSLRFLVIQKYEILQIINFMRLTFLCGNGERVQEFIRVAIDQHSQLKLKYFSECLLFDTNSEIIQRLSPSFYHTRSNNSYNSEISIFEDSIENHIGFQFKTLPVILEPYISYIHLSKYIQIFGFIVRLRYCQNLVSSSWKMLNNYKKQLQRRQSSQFQLRLVNKVYVIRYIIQNFVTTFENYLFFRVIEKEYKLMRLRINELNQFENNHLKMLDNIIRYGFIDNPHQNISKKFRQILNLINDFSVIVNMMTIDDLPRYMHDEVERKIEFIHLTFRKEQTNIQNLLFKVQ